MGKLQNLRVAVQRRWNNTVSDTSRQQVAGGRGAWLLVAFQRVLPPFLPAIQRMALLQLQEKYPLLPTPLCPAQAMELFLGLRIHDRGDQKGYFPGLQVGTAPQCAQPQMHALRCVMLA